METIINFILENWEAGIGISVLLATLLGRLVPTDRATIYVDIIGWIVKLIPNRKKGGGVH